MVAKIPPCSQGVENKWEFLGPHLGQDFRMPNMWKTILNYNCADVDTSPPSLTPFDEALAPSTQYY